MDTGLFMSDVDTGHSEEYVPGTDDYSNIQQSGNPTYPATAPTPSEPGPSAGSGDWENLSSTPPQTPRTQVSPPLPSTPVPPPLSSTQSPSPLPSTHTSASVLTCVPASSSHPCSPDPPPYPEDDQEPRRMELEGAEAPRSVSFPSSDLEEDCYSGDLPADVLSRLPDDLKIEYVDGVIIHHEDDLNLARELRTQMLQLTLSGGNTPKIALENENMLSGRSEIYNFEMWFKRSTWVFLLITDNFCLPESHPENYKTDMSLTESCLYPRDKKNFVIPIFTASKRCGQNIPASLRVLAGVQCHSTSGSLVDAEKNKLAKSLSSRIEERKEKEEKQREKQRVYLHF